MSAMNFNGNADGGAVTSGEGLSPPGRWPVDDQRRSGRSQKTEKE